MIIVRTDKGSFEFGDAKSAFMEGNHNNSVKEISIGLNTGERIDLIRLVGINGNATWIYKIGK